MNTALRRFSDWEALCRQCGYRARSMAVELHISLRHLQRVFAEQRNPSPQFWASRLRILDAIPKLQSGLSIKETAYELGYKHPAQFTRDFKRALQQPPSQWIPTHSPTDLNSLRQTLTRPNPPQNEPETNPHSHLQSWRYIRG